jgi:hypothetical protein
VANDENNRFFVSMLNHSLVDKSVVLYEIQVNGPYNSAFTVHDRYSNISKFHDSVVKGLTNKHNLPSFPGKKLIGKTNPDFIRKRKGLLETFFNNFLAHPEVNFDKKVIEYFSMLAGGTFEIQT